MPKVIVTVTGFTSANYHKTLATVSEVQIHRSFACMEPSTQDLTPETIRGISIVVNPKDFPDMERFVVTVRNIDS